jgi:hypothetical protein
MMVTKIRSLSRARGLLSEHAEPTTRRGLLFWLVFLVICVSIGEATGLLIWGGSWVFAVVSGVVIVLAGFGGRVYRYRRLAKSS